MKLDYDGEFIILSATPDVGDKVSS